MSDKKSGVGLRPSLESVRSAVDLYLHARLDEVENGFAEHASEAIVQAVAQATFSRASRIRPVLCCCGYAACSGDGGPLDKRIIAAASSLELLHTFAILHDDIMDGSSTRRGAPTVHVRAAEEHLTAGLRGDHDRFGVSVAILAGDLALVLSDSLLAESGFGANRLAAAAVPLGRMRLDAIAGQFLDLTHTGRAVTDPHLTSLIARLKTGSYSVEGPLLVGATLAGGSAAAKKALQNFARPLGEAFQLTDDLLGMFGDPADTGKSTENDLRQGKPTSLMARALSLATNEDRRGIMTIWGDPESSSGDLQILRETVARTGAVGSIGQSIDRLAAEAITALDMPEAQDLEPEPRTMMVHLATSIVARAAGLRPAQ